MAETKHKLRFDTSFGQGSLKLFEVTDELLEEAKSGSVMLKAHGDQDVVMCTQSKTYNVEQVDSSNTCYCVAFPEGKEEGNIFAEINATLSISPAVPKLHYLRQMLMDAPYPPQEDEEVLHLPWEELQAKVPASDDEILKALEDLDACEIDGGWKQLTDVYKFEAYDALQNLLLAKEWKTDSIPMEEAVEELSSVYPKPVVLHLLTHYGVKKQEGTVALKKEAIFRLVGTALLSTIARTSGGIGAKFPLAEFMVSWKNVLSECWSEEPDLTCLRGYVLLEDTPAGQVIKYLPRSSLPPTPEKRFATLFDVRERWILEELVPFIEDLVGPGASQADLMLKYTRSTLMPDGSREYSCR